MKFLCFLLFTALFFLGQCFNIHIIVLVEKISLEVKEFKILQKSLINQAKAQNYSIFISSSIYEWNNVPGWWAVWPIFLRLNQEMLKYDWTLICSVNVQIKLSNLLNFLYLQLPVPHDVPAFFGRSLFDKKPVIIHHFYGYESSKENMPFFYPDLANGVILSNNLLNNLNKNIQQNSLFFDHNFIIDVNFELAMLIKNVNKIALNEINNKKIDMDYIFCNGNEIINLSDHCYLYYKRPAYLTTKINKNDQKVLNNEVFFAVKTFSGYHKTRVPIIEKTWAKDLKNLFFFSDVERLPLIINLGIPNTKQGHCKKTFAIFSYFMRFNTTNNFRWLVIADDDTLLNVDNLMHFLNFVSSENELIIGQRYGYGYLLEHQMGYDYPTGGASMVFTRKAVDMILTNCFCPFEDSPDDMMIGLCAQRLRIPILDVPGFHQAQPSDYSLLLLNRQRPLISFHKFENSDPYQIYDILLKSSVDNIEHDEL